MVKIVAALLLPLIAGATVHGAAAAAEPMLTYQQGIARKPRLAVELYREQHWLRSDAGRPIERLVLYRCVDGTPFARKVIDYRQSMLAPAFVMVDQRSGYQEGLRRGQAATLFYRDGDSATERNAALGDGPVVADAGFDEFVHANWTQLAAGRVVPLRFAVPARLESWAFALSRAGQAVVDGEKAWVFRLKFASWLAWVAPTLDISYGQASRRLLRFEGMSNLRSDVSAKPVQTRIDFPMAPHPVAASAWQAALQVPLSACRIGQ